MRKRTDRAARERWPSSIPGPARAAAHRRVRSLLLALLAGLLFPLALASQTAAALPGPQLRFEPLYGIPLGAEEGIFGPQNFGASLGLRLGSKLFGMPWLAPEFGLGFSTSLLSQGGSQLSSFEPMIGLGAGLPLGTAAELRVALFARYAIYDLNQGSTITWGGSPGIALELGPDFRLGPEFSLGLGASCGYDFGMFGFVRPYLAGAYRLGAVRTPSSPIQKIESAPKPQPLVGQKTPPAAAPAPAQTLEVAFDGIFPVYYKFYDDHPFGSILVKNTGKQTWSDLRISLNVKQIMDSPRTLPAIASLAPGESRRLDTTALFSEEILGVTEATKLSCEISLEYRENGRDLRTTQTQALRVYDRNALTWTDDRSAAAFVTAKDPLVLSLAKSLAGDANAAKNPAINTKLQLAAAVHDALCLYGVNYVTDPTSVFAGTKAKTEVDFLQFPRQTLEYRAGDCDDLSILYSAFLEAIGIESAFITVPGHIFVAASLDMSPDEARLKFAQVDDFIFKDGKTWVPIEVTLRKGGFLVAWAEAAKEWRESSARGQASLIPVHAAWGVYEPVGLPGMSSLPPLPNAEAVKAMSADTDAYIIQDIAQKSSKLQAEIRKTQGAARSVNALGLLYAQYGLYDKAQLQFESIVGKEEYAPALVNLGNIHKIKGDSEGALALYDRAYRKAPDNPYVLLALARTNQELENFGVVKRYYQALKKINPGLAERYSYLDLKGEEGTKAAEAAGLQETVEWAEGL